MNSVRSNLRTDDDWRLDAECRGADTAIFFPEDDETADAAQAVCARCPASEACLEFALLTRQDEGVWGGLTGNERKRLRRRRREAARRQAA